MKRLIIFLLFSLVMASAADADVLKIRRDTSANWTKYNPILAQGEQGCEMTGAPLRCMAMKIGDGATKWTSLPYFSTGGGGAANLTPAFSKWSTAGQSVDAGIQGTNTMLFGGTGGTRINLKKTPQPTLTVSQPWVDTADAAFATVTAQSITNGIALHVSTPITIATDTDLSTIPEIDMIQGGSFNVNSGVTLTLPVNFHVGKNQVFYGPGAIAGLQEVWPETFGAKRDGVTDDSAAFIAAKAAMKEGGIFHLALGTYRLKSQFNLDKPGKYLGTSGDTNGRCTLSFQLTSGTAGVHITADSVTLSDAYVSGNNDAVRDGVLVEGTSVNYVTYTRLHNVWSAGWVNGIKTTYAYMTTIEESISANNSSQGYHILNGATTTRIDRCWALNNGSHGYHIQGSHYSSLSTCASDGNGGNGYFIETSRAVGLRNCGAENNALEALVSSIAYVNVDGFEGVLNAASSTSNASFIYAYNSGSITIRNAYEYSTAAGYAGARSIIIEGTVEGHVSNLFLQKNLYTNANSNLTGNDIVWIASGDTPTYIASDTFSVPGDQRTKYASMAKLRLQGASYKVFSTVASTTYSGGVTTVTLNSPVLSGTLTAVEYSPNGYTAALNGQNKTIYGSAPPTVGTWLVGDMIIDPTSNGYGQYVGAKCVSSGTPGTWKGFGWIPAKSNTRPTTAFGTALGSKDWGVTHLDTTLHPDGLLIYWNGSAWLKTDGSSASNSIPTIASAATISPTTKLLHVTGTAAISTINLPYTGFADRITLIPDGAWTLVTGGNIATGATPAVSKPLPLYYDGSYWYPDGGNTYLTGSGLTAGSVYYMGASGLALAKADSASTLPAVCIATSATQCAYAGVYSGGTWTQGAKLYVSDATAGALTATAPSTAGRFVQAFGVAATASSVLALPSLDVGGL